MCVRTSWELWKNTDPQALTPRDFNLIGLGWGLGIGYGVCVCTLFSAYSNVQPELRTAGLEEKVIHFHCSN